MVMTPVEGEAMLSASAGKVEPFLTALAAGEPTGLLQRLPHGEAAHPRVDEAGVEGVARAQGVDHAWWRKGRAVVKLAVAVERVGAGVAPGQHQLGVRSLRMRVAEKLRRALAVAALARIGPRKQQQRGAGVQPLDAGSGLFDLPRAQQVRPRGAGMFEHAQTIVDVSAFEVQPVVAV